MQRYPTIYREFTFWSTVAETGSSYLNPALVEFNSRDVDLLAPALRRELLTPLSTIVATVSF